MPDGRAIPLDRFEEEREGPDPDTHSIRAICTHCVRASRGYANYIRQTRGLPVEAITLTLVEFGGPDALRGHLREALRYTEAALDGLYDATEEMVTGLTFQVRWGPTYDPEMILEHGLVHILRHRRQIERWLAGG